MSFVKYRLKEVASDFGVNPKEISDIISNYYEKPKSPSQVLTDAELNVVFEHMTQKHPISSLEQVFAVAATAPKAKEAPKEEPKQEAKQEAPKPQQGKQSKAPAQPKQQSQNNARPAANNPAPQKAAEPERKRERRVVDTSAVQVNSSRFDDVDNLVSERVQNFQGGKQRIGGGKGKQQQKQQKGNFKGSKSRNEEQEKMRRLQMEVIAVVDRLPVSQKVSLARRAQDLINAGQLDSVSVIRALEKTLGTEFDF